MILINVIGRLHNPYDFFIDYSASSCLNRTLYFHFGPKMTKIKPEYVILSEITDFGPEMKVQRSIEGPGCSEIIIKVIREMESSNKVDQNHLECKI